MGRAIVYCGDCGRSLREDDFERGRAQTLDGQPYCSTCRALLPEAIPASSRARPRDASSGSTRRVVVVPPGPLRRPPGLWVGVGALAGGVLLILLLSGGGRRPPPPPHPIREPVVLDRPAPAKPPEKPPTPRIVADPARVEAEMLVRKAADDAARLDRFVASIADMIRERPGQRDEIGRMIDTLPPARKADADRLRADLAARPKDQKADIALPKEAAPAWRVVLDFETGFQKGVQRIEDWGGLAYTEDPALVHGGRRAVLVGPKSVGVGYHVSGVEAGRTYRMSSWARRLGDGAGRGYVGFEFVGDADKRLGKEAWEVTSTSYTRFQKDMKAPPGTRAVMIWIWSEAKGGAQYLLDDADVTLKP
ncbi:MAG TPA: hypothetical protein VF950_09965 [Planctomycetota bacterium]